MDAEELKRRVDELGWCHSIDLGQGVVTKGLSQLVPLTGDKMPSFEGKTVLDIGAWDGGYSWIAEKAGAKRVVALDHYAWGVNLGARQAYWEECAAKGTLPDHGRDETDFWDASLPGKKGFDLAHEVFDSSVEAVVGDLMKIDTDKLGTFDVVLYCGVLYHMQEPLTALRRVRAVTAEGGVAVVETVAVRVLGHKDASLLSFYPGNELGGADFGNWFAPTEAALIGLCKAAGFSRAVAKAGPPDVPGHLDRMPRGEKVLPYRAVVHAFA
ncbi:MAG TPA: methyltransferase domain-containing protein [Acidimicrobiales bacterium]|nr:methyltransferase domain-containing protein [Acidimicrobiales bacterium]